MRVGDLVGVCVRVEDARLLTKEEGEEGEREREGELILSQE